MLYLYVSDLERKGKKTHWCVLKQRYGMVIYLWMLLMYRAWTIILFVSAVGLDQCRVETRPGNDPHPIPAECPSLALT